MRTTLDNLLASDAPVITDGAMGTMLFSLGLQNGESPEMWNVDMPDKVGSVHRTYIEAGAQIILTNTFGCNRIRLAMHDLGDRVTELNVAAAQIASAAAEAAQHPVVVAGSIGPTGSMLAPLGDLAFEEAAAAFEEQAVALVDGGVDVLWIETMFDLTEVRAAVEGCRRAAPQHPIVTTMTFDTHGRTMMGVTPEQAIESIGEMEIIAVGGNCGNGPQEIETVIEKMRSDNPDMVLIAKANAGMPIMDKDVPYYDATPEVMADYALKVRDLGANIIGACCGSTPDHIRAMTQALGKTVPSA